MPKRRKDAIHQRGSGTGQAASPANSPAKVFTHPKNCRPAGGNFQRGAASPSALAPHRPKAHAAQQQGQQRQRPLPDDLPFPLRLSSKSENAAFMASFVLSFMCDLQSGSGREDIGCPGRGWTPAARHFLPSPDARPPLLSVTDSMDSMSNSLSLVSKRRVTWVP